METKPIPESRAARARWCVGLPAVIISRTVSVTTSISYTATRPSKPLSKQWGHPSPTKNGPVGGGS